MEWEKYFVQHVKYHIILEILTDHVYQGLDPGSKVGYLLNDIRCDKLSAAVVAVWARPKKYEKDFDAVVDFLTQYIDNRASTPSVKVASVSQTTSVKQQETTTNNGTLK